jgi:hypothetical protein
LPETASSQPAAGGWSNGEGQGTRVLPPGDFLDEEVLTGKVSLLAAQTSDGDRTLAA